VKSAQSFRLYHPREVAEALGLAPSTLRIYAARFQDLLSPDARPARPDDGRRARHRRYTSDDVVVLQRAKALLDAGLTYDAVSRQIKGDGDPIAIQWQTTVSSSVRRRRSAADAAAHAAVPSIDSEDILTRANAAVAAAIGPVLQSIEERLATLDERLTVQQEAILDLASRIDVLRSRLDESDDSTPTRPGGPSVERRRSWLTHILGND